jgi:D-alanyl-D-alanine dipeptidase
MTSYRLAGSLILLLACQSPAPFPQSPVPDTALQLVLVRTANWDDIHGRIQRFTRSDRRAPWKSVTAPEPIVVGRTGLAWGRGLHGDSVSGPGPVKHEGDGKSPAGVFSLSRVFGYAPGDSMTGLRMPYIQATDALKCVDDPENAAYNTLIDAPATGRPSWQSAENMRRNDEAYRVGVFVDHNAGTQRKPGGGSCIFLHVWSGADSPTVGCTAMPMARMEDLAMWLDAGAHPILVQLPEGEYARLKGEWKLP